MALSVDGLPSFGSLTDNGDGTGALVFDPHFVDDGIYTISVTVADRGLPSLADSESFTLTVRDVTDTRAVDLQVNTSSSSGGTRGVAVVEGATLDYTITVSNNGPRDITGAVVADTFPAELSSVAWTAAVTTGTGNVSANGSGDINESFNLTSGSVITFNVRGTVVGSLAINQAAAKIVTNTFTVTAPAGIVDSDPSNNSATDSDIVVLAATGGSGIFSASNNRLGIANSFDVSLGDVDGDGDLDAFVANFGQPNQVWLNDGSGGFSDSGQSLGSSDSRGVSLGDLDGDGDLDAFVATVTVKPNRVWLNDGSGKFTDSGQEPGKF